MIIDLYDNYIIVFFFSKRRVSFSRRMTEKEETACKSETAQQKQREFQENTVTEKKRAVVARLSIIQSPEDKSRKKCIGTRRRWHIWKPAKRISQRCKKKTDDYFSNP